METKEKLYKSEQVLFLEINFSNSREKNNLITSLA